MNKFGIVVYRDEVVYLTQHAYLAGTPEAPRYQARGMDLQGSQYHVTWTPVENFMEIEDESLVCDWDHYEIERL
jgi:hypothetical protein